MEIYINNSGKIVLDKLSKKIAQKRCLCENMWDFDLNLHRSNDLCAFAFNLYAQNPETDELSFLASYNLDASTRTGTYPLLKNPVCNQLTNCLDSETCVPVSDCDICKYLKPPFDEFELDTFSSYCREDFETLTGSIEKGGVLYLPSGPSWDGCSPYVPVPCSTLSELHDRLEIISTDTGTENFDDNLADYMSESDLDSLGSDLVADFEKDLRDRKEWVQTYIEGLKLLGLKYEERTEPWNGACGVFHPMLTESVVRFQAEAITETFPAAGPVKTVIIGKETTAKKESAERVQADMNYQLTEVMTEYRPEHEKMLWSLPITGSAFKKVYYDPHMERQVSVFVPAEDIVVPYGASDIETAPRVTHVMRKTENELRRLHVAIS